MWAPSDGIMQYGEIRLREVETGKIDVAEKYKGFFFSEKMDGWFVVWDGKDSLFTKSGKIRLPAPKSFLKHLPKGTAISGELIVKGEQATSVAGLRKENGPLWSKAKLYAFDLPGDRRSTFSTRTAKLKKIVEKQCARSKADKASKTGGAEMKCPLRYIKQHTVTTNAAFLKKFFRIVECTGEHKTKKGGAQCFGEGVVLTDPESLYVPGRASSKVRAKLKRREDKEGKVVGHGAHSLLVQYSTKAEPFTLGIGFKANERERLKELFPIGTVVKYSYRSLGKNGFPKEARFVGKREKADMS